MTSGSITQKLQENKLLLISSFFFLAWKYFFLHILWKGRLLAPEPDDSYTYISHIASVIDCQRVLFCETPFISLQTGSGYIYLSYRIILGIFGRITSISPETIYYLSFYAGTLLLLLALIPFIKIFTSDKKLLPYALFFLALYHGMGEIHGFYWVVPSFFATCLFFILATFILSKKEFPTWPFLLIALFYTYFHPMSVYLIAIFPIYHTVHFFFTRTIMLRSWKRTVFIIATVLLSSYAQTLYLAQVKGEAFYSPNKSFVETKKIVKDLAVNKTPHIEMTYYNVTPVKNNNFFDRKILSMYSVYFKWLLPHWVCLFPFLLMLFLLALKKEYQLLSFYLASLTFFIIATFLNEYGFRSAIILWPVTYLLFAFGSWHLFKILSALDISFFLKQILKLFFVLCIFFFTIINFLYALTINYNINIRNDYGLPKELPTYLMDHAAPNASIHLNYTLLRTDMGRQLLSRYSFVSLENSPTYLILVDESAMPSRQQKVTEKIVNQISLTLRGKPFERPALKQEKAPPGYVLLKKFDALNIFEKSSP